MQYKIKYRGILYKINQYNYTCTSPSRGGPQSLLGGGTQRPVDTNRSPSSEPCSGSSQVCPGLMWTLGELDGSGIDKDGAHNGLIRGHQGFGREAPVRPS